MAKVTRVEVPAPLPLIVCAPHGVALWEKHHSEVATSFCNVLLQIRREGENKFQDGMWSLWQAAEAMDPLAGGEDIDPTTHSMHSCYHMVQDLRPVTASKRRLPVGKSPYGGVSQRWLLSFEANARQLKDEHERILGMKGSEANALKRLVAALGKGLDTPGTRAMRKRKLHGVTQYAARSPIFGLKAGTADVPLEFEDVPGAWAVMPLVWLPLALYVRSTTHLYEMLDRLRRLHQDRAYLSSEEKLRAVMDRDRRRYSYLAFAITAALQTVILAKQELGRKMPFSLLASSPPSGDKTQINGYPMTGDDYSSTAVPIFRGIWVGAEIDEERAMFQYSFQSFSRQVSGVAHVLSFYSSVEGSPTAKLAAAHKHVLFLVARQRYSNDECFALPVQFMDGPRADKSEMEVMLPPFARYEFDNELALSSADFGLDGPSLEAQRKMEKLKATWKGFQLPPLLLSLLKREAVVDEFPEIRALKPFVSVRFVTKITLAEPMTKLFTGAATRLYDFEPDDLRELPKKSFGRNPGMTV